MTVCWIRKITDQTNAYSFKTYFILIHLDVWGIIFYPIYVHFPDLCACLEYKWHCMCMCGGVRGEKIMYVSVCVCVS